MRTQFQEFLDAVDVHRERVVAGGVAHRPACSRESRRVGHELGVRHGATGQREHDGHVGRAVAIGVDCAEHNCFGERRAGGCVLPVATHNRDRGGGSRQHLRGNDDGRHTAHRATDVRADPLRSRSSAERPSHARDAE